MQTNCPEVNNVTNFKGEDNYTVLDVEGTGHYVGCNLTVKHYQGSWWGEGNDMFFIDGEEYPSLNGTGTEDYFNHAWGMQKNAYPFFGTIVHESDTDGFQVSYRFHITDPVRFEKSLKVTIEHGHANHLSDDWSSTAYWYQTLPTSKPLTILPVEERLPNVATLPEQQSEVARAYRRNEGSKSSMGQSSWEEYKRQEKNSLELKKVKHAVSLNLILNLQKNFVKIISNTCMEDYYVTEIDA